MVPVGSSKLSYLTDTFNVLVNALNDQDARQNIWMLIQYKSETYFSLTAFALRSLSTATGFDRSLNTRGSERSSSSEV